MNSSFESLIEQYPLPIAEQLRHWAARYASRIAVVDAKGSLTYSALDAQVDELAAGLSSLGLRSGEHVIVQLPNDSWPDRWRTNTPACVMFWSLERP